MQVSRNSWVIVKGLAEHVFKNCWLTKTRRYNKFPKKTGLRKNFQAPALVMTKHDIVNIVYNNDKVRITRSIHLPLNSS